jgi:hypothetical protein
VIGYVLTFISGAIVAVAIFAVVWIRECYRLWTES